MRSMKKEHQERLAKIFEEMPPNNLGALFRCAFYDPFELREDAIDRMAHMPDELVVSALEEALPRAVNYFIYRGKNA